MKFSEASPDHRMDVRKAIERVGSKVHSYSGNGFIVAIGQCALIATEQVCKELGYHMTALVKFPLCSDRPDWHLQHDGNWLFASFEA